MDDKSEVRQSNEEHQRRFHEWLDSNLAANSSLVSTNDYEAIKAALKGKSKPSYNLKRRLERNKFKLVSHEGLGFYDALCVPANGSQIQVGIP